MIYSSDLSIISYWIPLGANFCSSSDSFNKSKGINANARKEYDGAEFCIKKITRSSMLYNGKSTNYRFVLMAFSSSCYCSCNWIFCYFNFLKSLSNFLTISSNALRVCYVRFILWDSIYAVYIWYNSWTSWIIDFMYSFLRPTIGMKL